MILSAHWPLDPLDLGYGQAFGSLVVRAMVPTPFRLLRRRTSLASNVVEGKA